MRYTVNAESFLEIPVTTGTIQNVSNTDIEVSNEQVVGSGLVLKAGEMVGFNNTTVYVCARPVLEGGTGIISVVPFSIKGEGGGGGSYVLPIATKTVLGGVKSSDTVGKIKVDGFGVMTYNAPEAQPLEAPEWAENTAYTVNALVEHNDNVYMCLIAHTSTSDFEADLAGGKWKLVGLALEVATTTTLGGVKANDADGGVSVASDGVMTINLPTASTTTKGGVKVGTGVEVVSQKLNVIPATTSAVGGVLSSTADGKIKVETDGTMTMNLPTASTTVKGGIKVGTGVEVDANQKLNVTKATASVIGGVKSSSDAGKVAVDANGIMTVNDGKYLPLTGGTLTGVLNGTEINAYNSWYKISNGFVPANNAYISMNYKDSDQQTLLNLLFWANSSANGSGKGFAFRFVDQDGTLQVPLSMGLSYPQKKLTLVGVTPDINSNGTNIATTAWIRTNGHYDNAASHNAHYRGKDLTSYMESGDMSTAIANGSFTDIFPGDYIIKSVTLPAITYTDKAGTEVTQAAQTFSNVKWLVAALDPHLHCGDTETTAHHVLLIPSITLQYNVSMNPTDDTTGAYIGSDMWTVHMPNWATAIQNAFGSAHVLSHREMLTNAINTTVQSTAGGFTGKSSAWEWASVTVNIPNEAMIYGSSVFGSSFDVGDFSRILPLFAHKNRHLDDRRWFWLRAVASSANFSVANGYGAAYYSGASVSHVSGGIRPYFLLK